MHALRVLFRVVLALLTVTTPLAQGQMGGGEPRVEAQLLSSTSAVVPGRPFDVGLLLEMAPGWHTYWEYSGDAGFPTQIRWSLPDGFRAGPIRWPAPELKIEPGNLRTYGYSGKVLLLTTITPPDVMPADQQAALRAHVSWLACRDTCVPGEKDVVLELPVASASAPTHEKLFDEFRAQVPSMEPPPFHLTWTPQGQTWQLLVSGVPPDQKTALYPLPHAGQTIGQPTLSAPATFLLASGEGGFRGILAVGEGGERRAWHIQRPASQTQGSSTGLWLALLNGFLGGLILNLMPCVLPVISLKVFGFIRQAGDAPDKIFAHGLAFAGGIFTWFAGLAGAILLVKSGGTEVTWAFQFQNPWFNVIIGSALFVFALNLFGVFEIVLPGRANTALHSATPPAGLSGSFFQGVFATLLATPCSAPFLGTALGFAFSQSTGVILGMLGAVAFGMALPYLLLAARPGWMKFLPRPGAWMGWLKQLMGFPLLATLLWILGIIEAQRGADGVLSFLAFLVCLGLACWIYGTFSSPLSSPRVRVFSLLLIALITGGGGTYFLGKKFARPIAEAGASIAWTPFSPEQIAALQAQDKPVFVDFTAEWCITCKFNERTAIDVPAVRALIAKKGVVPMKADWTKPDPKITAALKAFGRVGVPLYVIYPPGNAAPVLLPELLTETIVVDALQKLPPLKK